MKDESRLIMSMLSNGNSGTHVSTNKASSSSSSSVLKKSFRIDDLLSKKSANKFSSHNQTSNHSSNSNSNINHNHRSSDEDDPDENKNDCGMPTETLRKEHSRQNQNQHQHYHHRDHQSHQQTNNSKIANRIDDYPHQTSRDRRTSSNSKEAKLEHPKLSESQSQSQIQIQNQNQTPITIPRFHYPQSSERDRDRERERDRIRDRDHVALFRQNNSHSNWGVDSQHLNVASLTELRKNYHQQEASHQHQIPQATYRYDFDPHPHPHQHPSGSQNQQSPRITTTSSPGVPLQLQTPSLCLPEQFAPPLTFSSVSQLTHYQETIQRYHDFINASNSSQIPFSFYNGSPTSNPLHHPALSLSTLSAFRSLCPSGTGPGDTLALSSLSSDDLATARNSFSHPSNGLYAASLAYLGTNPSSFSITPLLGNSHGNKRKGGQIRFTNYQTSQLEKSFMDHKYLNANDRKKLATSLGLSDRQVKTWFQNRRAKWRKCKEIHCQDMEGDMSKCSSSDRQPYSPDPGNCDSPATSGLEDEEQSP